MAPRYKATETGYANDTYYEPGAEFEFDGVPGSWMEPLDDEARSRFEARGEDGKEKAPNYEIPDKVPAPSQGNKPKPEPEKPAKDDKSGKKDKGDEPEEDPEILAKAMDLAGYDEDGWAKAPESEREAALKLAAEEEKA